jgi:aspartyl-tRNA(Asn)/glutamyl-tRNA(Gln) amidotransferase subunit A
MVGLGTDTAGSIRIPASLCGTVGLKPTYGRVSRRGITPLSWSLDHAGPLARNVRDCALVLNTIAGPDPQDPATVDVPVADYTAGLDRGVAGLRIGVPTNYYFDRLEPAVDRAVREAVTLLVDLGAEVHEVTVPFTETILAAEWAICMPEASAYHQQSLRASADLYTDQVRTIFEAGEFVFATDYIKALRVRTLMQRAWASMFQDIDVLVTPGMPSGAPQVGTEVVSWPDGSTEDVTTSLVRLTSATNLTGHPVLSVPVGRNEAGLPLGMQVTGRPFDEATVLRVGQAYESASGNVGAIAPL